MGAEGNLPPAQGRALITGGSGGLGRAMIPSLQADGWRVRALVHERPVARADEEARGSFADEDSLAAAMKDVDVVLHMAALTHARCAADYERINVAGTRQLVDAARKASISRFVLVSSRTAVPGAGAYGESKLAGEEVLRRSGLPHVVLRPAEVFGAGGAEGIDGIIGRAGRGARIPIVGRGEARICPVHIGDVVPAVVAATTTHAAVGGTYVLGGAEMSIREFAEICVAESGSDSRIVGIPTPLIVLASLASALLPLPIYPDQLARLEVAKPGSTREALADLGFSPRPVGSTIGQIWSGSRS